MVIALLGDVLSLGGSKSGKFGIASQGIWLDVYRIVQDRILVWQCHQMLVIPEIFSFYCRNDLFSACIVPSEHHVVKVCQWTKEHLLPWNFTGFSIWFIICSKYSRVSLVKLQILAIFLVGEAFGDLDMVIFSQSRIFDHRWFFDLNSAGFSLLLDFSGFWLMEAFSGLAILLRPLFDRFLI